MRIHHTGTEDNGVAIPTSTLQDGRLSYTARGLLCELLTMPDGWETNADDLAQKARAARGVTRGEGRKAIRAAFAELETYGYLLRRKTRLANGRYVTYLELHDTPGHGSLQPRREPANQPEFPRGHVLYRHWDAEGCLLYVGVTRNARARERAHIARSPWMRFHARTAWEQHPSRQAVEAAESAAIMTERPLFNVAGNDHPDARMRLAEYLQGKGCLDLTLWPAFH